MTTRTQLQSLALRAALGLGIGLLVVILTHVGDVRLLRDIELLTIDFRFQQRGVLKDVSAQGNVVIVDISDEDLADLPDTYPFPRTYYAHVIENLNRAGARTIVLDVPLDQPSASDDSLRAILNRTDNVVLGVKALTQETHGKYLIRSAERDYANVFYDIDKRVGAVNVPLDPDNVVRRYLPFVWSSGFLTPTLAFGALNHAYRLPADSLVGVSPDAFLFGDREIQKVDDESFLMNYYGPPRTFRFVPFSHVIDDASFWTKDELEIEEQINTFDENLMRVFSNKVVIVGSTIAEDRDSHITPMRGADGQRSMDAGEIHATAIQNVIDRSIVQRPNADLEIVLILFLSVVTFLSIITIKRLRIQSTALLEVISILVVLLFLAGIVELATLQFSSQNLLMNIVNPALAVICAFLGTIVFQYFSGRQQKSLIKNVFSRYISKETVDVLMADPGLAKLGGDEREVTVLYSDIADFSTISEPLPPEKLVHFLHEYRDEMSSIILNHGGTLSTCNGDAIMAFWGAPLVSENHATRACLAALEMQARLDQIRPRWQRTGKPAVDVRIGIDTGTVIVGNVGGKERFDYTVIGESVNLAHRLEAANKEYRSRVIISQFTYARVQEGVLSRDLGLLRVKGRPEPVRVWELLSTVEFPLSAPQQQSLDAYHEGLRLYRERKWNEAIALLQQAKSLDPTCHAADIYEQRASHHKLNPPPADWDGVFTVSIR